MQQQATARLVPIAGFGRGFCIFMFLAWGLVGGLIVCLAALAMLTQANVGIGTSGYVVALATVWLGGTVFWGFSVLMLSNGFTLVPTPKAE